MKAITIQTTERVVPMIYAYTTPEIKRHDGWTKIGYTEQDVEKRIKQQTHTADVEYKEEWRGQAVFDDGSGESFHDTDFHAYLRKQGYEQEAEKSNEWFHIMPPESREKFYDFRANRGILKSLDTVVPYTLRDEQAKAVEKAIDYCRSHEKGEFLWNAKPRFGKTLSAYDFCRRIQAQNVLIVTNRPSIANSWYSDYERFFGPESGYLFVSNSGSLQGRKCVLTRDQYISTILANHGEEHRCIEFISLQDLKGSIDFGGKFEKNTELAGITWDVLIIDEAHEGVDTYKTDVAFNQIKRKFTLHLSGTPFKALANDKFSEDAIFNWTYAEEQRAKHDWDDSKGTNPYETLPQLNLFTYQMSEIIRDELEQGVEINGETEEYAFDLNEFFSTNGTGAFVHSSAVDKFLDAMTSQVKFPFSTDELRCELKHTLWLLNRVDSAKALAKKLKEHPVFKEYRIVLAAGDGRMSDGDVVDAAFNRVNAAIEQYDKTITLSVGQLTTGVTIPQWTAVMMLSNIKSPALYMQAAFRAQNPWMYGNNGQFFRKERAYVFDFDPARTLTIFEEFANDLSSDTSDGRGDTDTRKNHVRELLNFFPVLGEDENGEMIELDAEKVLTIPRKIRSQEVVRRGFMSNYLFQNISNIFGAPQEVLDIIQQFTPVDEPKNKTTITTSATADLPLDENGDIKLDDEYVIGQAADVFGPKIFDNVSEKFDEAISKVEVGDASKDNELERLKDLFYTMAVNPIIDKAEEKYVGDIKVSEKKRLERKLNEDADRIIEKSYGDFSIKNNKIEQQRKQQLSQANSEDVKAINLEFDKQKQEAAEQLKKELADSVDNFLQSSSETVVRTVETSKKEKEKQTIEDAIRDHLRGFSRTIPSFLMAYGTEDTTLGDFDRIIPDAVFKDVTSISVEQFRFLRDGGDYTDEETGETRHFEGRLFDPVVFDDSVKEFLRLRLKLANYFDETHTEDIFDYIPPQKTNQIFTPKNVVKQMVDMLEQENPGCYDDPNKTFLDPYMKSGMYITEIVKRLYRSEKLQKAYPDANERLQHIFEKQVYGLAPTEIIYRIALRYILGFGEGITIEKHNLKQVDALPFAKEGTLEKELDKVFTVQ